MDNDKKKILEYSLDVFLREGFYKTKMDDIASQLRISKKTIYKYFSTKEELVTNVIFAFLNYHKENIGKIIQTDFSSVKKLNEIFKYLAGFIAKINEKFLLDVQIQMPDLWKEIDEFRTKIMTKNIGSIIQQGIGEGLFIDKPLPLIVNVFISSIRGVINPEFILNSKFSIKIAVENTIEILMNGILTDKGKKAFKILKSEQTNEDDYLSTNISFVDYLRMRERE